MIFGTIARKGNENGGFNGEYLGDRVSLSDDKLMDSDSKAEIMGWEKPLTEGSCKSCVVSRWPILNIIFGMGVVDTAMQQYKPTSRITVC